MTKEIKATAPTREELYQDYKRAREENERLRVNIQNLNRCIGNLAGKIKQLESKTND